MKKAKDLFSLKGEGNKRDKGREEHEMKKDMIDQGNGSLSKSVLFELRTVILSSTGLEVRLGDSVIDEPLLEDEDDEDVADDEDEARDRDSFKGKTIIPLAKTHKPIT